MKDKFKKPRKGNATKASTAFVKKVQAVIHKNSEDKYVTLFPNAWTGLAIQPGAGWNGQGTAIYQSPPIRNNAVVSNIIPLLPPIEQSNAVLGQFSEAMQRVGNRITPKSLRVDFTVSFRSDNVNANQLMVRLMCLSDKSIRNVPDLIASAGVPGTPTDAELFNYGNGTYGTFNGIPYDMKWRVNRNRYTVHSDKVFRLEKGYGQLPAPTNPVPYAGSVTTISPAMTKSFSVNIPTPKELIYETNTKVYPSNFAPFWACGFVQPDGDGTVVYLTDYIMVNYTTHLVFEDS